jgi:hypothetical protein
MRPCDERKYLAWFDSLGESEQDSVILSLMFCNLMGLIGISNTAQGLKSTITDKYVAE